MPHGGYGQDMQDGMEAKILLIINFAIFTFTISRLMVKYKWKLH